MSSNSTDNTIVTGFFDIDRDNWDFSSRSTSKYFDFGKRVLSLDNNMIIFIDEKYNNFVLENRRDKMHKTIIKNINIGSIRSKGDYFRFIQKSFI